MALLRLISLGALAAVGAVAVAPSSAHACSIDPCADSSEFGSLRVAHETVTVDGVLLLSSYQGNSDGLTPEAAIARMGVVVMDADVEHSGTIEHTAGAYFWRPDGPLPAGSSLSVSVSWDADPDDLSQCGAGAGGDSTVTVLDETRPPLALPSIEFSTNYSFYEDVDFETGICCDEGTMNADSCNTPSFSGLGFCVAPSGVGYAQGRLILDALPASLAPGVAIEFLVDGEVDHNSDGLLPIDWAPSRPAVFDVQVRVTSLIDGSILESDVFTADGDNPDALGAQVVDIDAELEANCEGQAYTCETVDDFQWDEENCTPYGGGGTDSDSGGSDTDSGGSDSDSDSGSGGSDSDSGTAGSDSNSGGSDSDSAGSGSDTDGDPGQDDDGGGCSVGGSGIGGAWLLLLGFAALRRRRE